MGTSAFLSGNSRTQHRPGPFWTQWFTSSAVVRWFERADLRDRGPGSNHSRALFEAGAHSARSHSRRFRLRASRAAERRTGNVGTSEDSDSVLAQWEGAQCERSHIAGNLPTATGPLGSFAVAAFPMRTCRVATFLGADAPSAQWRESGTSQWGRATHFGTGGNFPSSYVRAAAGKLPRPAWGASGRRHQGWGASQARCPGVGGVGDLPRSCGPNLPTSGHYLARAGAFACVSIERLDVGALGRRLCPPRPSGTNVHAVAREARS